MSRGGLQRHGADGAGAERRSRARALRRTGHDASLPRTVTRSGARAQRQRPLDGALGRGVRPPARARHGVGRRDPRAGPDTAATRSADRRARAAPTAPAACRPWRWRRRAGRAGRAASAARSAAGSTARGRDRRPAAGATAPSAATRPPRADPRPSAVASRRVTLRTSRCGCGRGGRCRRRTAARPPPRP